MFETALQMGRRKGDRVGLAYASLGLACLAADLRDWQQASELHSAAQAFLNQGGLPWQQLEERYRQQSLGEVRSHLGDEQFDRTFARATALSYDDALDLALGKLRTV